MKRRTIVSILLGCGLLIAAASCSKNSGSPTQPNTPPPPQLSAVPPSVSLTAGGSQNVDISGGTPPYSIAGGPGAIATAALTVSDSVVGVLHIMGVSIASVSTTVTVRDSGGVKSVTIPISVH